MGSLQTGGFHFCGGSLIDPEWIVTAAHCVADLRPADLTVVLGRHDLNSAAGARHEVSQIVVHSQYDPATQDSDIALLHLVSASALPTIPLATSDQAALFAPGVSAVATGWGDLAEGGPAPSVLYQVSLPIVSNAIANQAYGGAVTDNMLAAGRASGGIDTCQGDSGGPLMVPDGIGGQLLAGLVSWGFGCARPGYYGIYTRVANFTDWVVGHVTSITSNAHHITLTSGQVVTDADFGNRLVNTAPIVLDVSINTQLSDPADLPTGSQLTSWSRQQSELRNITITFSETVQVTVNDLRLTNLGIHASSDPDTIVSLMPRHLALDGEMLTLSFEAGELSDGVYRLEVLASARDLQGTPLDGDGDGMSGDSYSLLGNSTNGLFQLTGDWNGDGDVSIFDFAALTYWFGHTLPTAPAYMDVNHDGGVSIFDFEMFSDNFGTGIGYPTGVANDVQATALAGRLLADFVRDERTIGRSKAKPSVGPEDHTPGIRELALQQLLAEWNDATQPL